MKITTLRELEDQLSMDLVACCKALQEGVKPSEAARSFAAAIVAAMVALEVRPEMVRRDRANKD